MDARQRRAQLRLLADHDGRARVVGERRCLLDDDLPGRLGRRELAVGRARECEAGTVARLERDDAERAREGIGEPGHETVRDVAPQRGAAEDAGQLVPLVRALALALGLAPPVQQDERDQEQHDRRRGGDERELEEEARGGRRRRAPSAAGR